MFEFINYILKPGLFYWIAQDITQYDPGRFGRDVGLLQLSGPVKVGIGLGQDGGAASGRQVIQAGEFIDLAAAFVAKALGHFHLLGGEDVDGKDAALLDQVLGIGIGIGIVVWDELVIFSCS